MTTVRSRICSDKLHPVTTLLSVEEARSLSPRTASGRNCSKWIVHVLAINSERRWLRAHCFTCRQNVLVNRVRADVGMSNAGGHRASKWLNETIIDPDQIGSAGQTSGQARTDRTNLSFT